MTNFFCFFFFNQDGLDLSLVVGNDGVDVKLNSAVNTQNKKTAFIVIEVISFSFFICTCST